MRKVFFEKLKEGCQKDKNIFMLVADLGVKFFNDFKCIDEKRFLNIGVAEQNMIGLAAGLSMAGKNVYCYSIIPFLIMRAYEQIRIDLCYNNLNVKLLGAGGGVVYGFEGITHHSIEDIAIMRSLPNMTVVVPGDSVESAALAEKSLHHQGPLYIRFGRDIESLVHEREIDFKIGKGIVVKEGEKICLIASGSMLYTSKLVTNLLKEKGLEVGLISMHTIKPLDEDLIRECAKKYQAIFTLEDHNVVGGLGAAVAEVLAESDYKGLFRRIGIPDKYTYEFGIGSPDFLIKKLGLDKETIYNYILKEIKNA